MTPDEIAATRRLVRIWRGQESLIDALGKMQEVASIDTVIERLCDYVRDLEAVAKTAEKGLRAYWDGVHGDAPHWDDLEDALCEAGILKVKLEDDEP